MITCRTCCRRAGRWLKLQTPPALHFLYPPRPAGSHSFHSSCFFFNVVCFVVLVVVFFLPQPTEGFGGAGRGGDFLSVKQVSSLWADIRSTELEIPEYGSKLVVF